MPRKARGRAGVKNTQVTQGIKDVEKQSDAPGKAQRLSKGASIQQSKQNQSFVAPKLHPVQSPDSQEPRRSTRLRREPDWYSQTPKQIRAQSTRKGEPTGQGKGLTKSSAAVSTSRARKAVRRRGTSRKLPKKPLTPSERPRDPTVAGWLDQIEPGSPGDLRRPGRLGIVPMGGDPERLISNMDSSETSKESGNPIEGESTTKAPGARKEKALTWEKLRARNVTKRVSKDDKLQNLRSTFQLALPERPLIDQDITRLKTIWDSFFQSATEKPKDFYPALETATDAYHRFRHDVHLATVTDREFEIDLARCRESNESVLQGAIMQTIIDRYQFHEILDYNCDGQWAQSKDNQVFSTQDDTVPLPKPDLAMSFTLDSLTDEEYNAPIPNDIKDCMRPDGGDRCFPFLFMEAKKAVTDLDEALRQNLNSASQALFNIYTWILRAGQEDLFFQDVRVFSMVLNAKDLSVRVHRAIPQPNGSLKYLFDELSPLSEYTKDQACLLIRSILDQYAIPELHTLLKDTFKEVSRQEHDRVETKQKAQNRGRASSKRPRVDGETASFGASSLKI